MCVIVEQWPGLMAGRKEETYLSIDWSPRSIQVLPRDQGTDAMGIGELELPDSNASRYPGLIKRDQGKCFPKECEFKYPITTKVEYSFKEVFYSTFILQSLQELK